MIDIRKLIVFISVLILFIYLLIRTLYSMKMYEIKSSLFLIMILGSGLFTIGTFFDLISSIYLENFKLLINISFTAGSVIFMIGVLLWDAYIRKIIFNLNKLAHTDSMTGIYNRRGFEQAFERIIKTHESFYVMVFDLDETKRINDSFGHLSGDKYIIDSVQIIKEAIGLRGFLGRTGGDEFAALIGHTDDNKIVEIETSIKKHVSKIFADKKTSISIGHSLYGKDGITFEQLLKAADKNMYKDKILRKSDISEKNTTLL